MSDAAGSKLATGWLELTVSTKGAQESIVKDVTGAGQKSGDNLGSQILGGLKKAAGPIAAVVAGFSVAKLVDAAQQKFLDLAGTTRTLARVAGGTTEQVSALAGGMRMAGLDSDKAQVALTMFSKNLGNANDGGENAAAMAAKLGGDFRDAAGNVKPMSEIMPILADKFQSMPNGAEKTALAMQLFGRSGAQVIPFLNNGAAGIADFTAQAKSMGLVLDDTSMSIWANARKSVREYSAAIDGAKGTLGQVLVPIIVGLQNVYRSAFIPVLQGISTFLLAHRAQFMAVGAVIDGFATRVRGAFAGIFTLFASGDVSGGLLRALGLEEDSVVISILLGIRDAAITVGNALGPIFTTIGQTVGAVFAQLAPTFAALLPQLVQLFTTLSPVQLIFQALAPILPQIVTLVGQLAATIGGVLGQALAALMPPLVQVATAVVGALMTAFQAVIPVLTALMPVITDIVAVVGGILTQVITALAPILTLIGGLFAQLAPVLGILLPPIMALIEPLLGLIAPLLQLVGPILTPVIQLLTALLTPILQLIEPILGLLVPALHLVTTVLGTVVGWISEAIAWFVQLITGNQEAGAQFQDVWSGIMGFFQGVGDFFATVWNAISTAFSTAWNAIVAFLQPAIDVISGIIRFGVEAWQNVILIFAAILKTIWDGIVAVVTPVWQGIVAFLTPIIQTISDVITGTLTVISTVWNTVWQGVSDFLTTVWNGLISFLVPIVLTVMQAVQGPIQALSDWWNAVWAGISGFFSGIWNGMVGAVSGAVGQIGSFIGGIWDTVMGALGNVGTWLLNAGGDLVRGFWDGISGMASWLWRQISGFFDGVVGWAKGVLGIQSPSRVFRLEVGRMVGAGMALGLEDSEAQVRHAMEALIAVPDAIPAAALQTGSAPSGGAARSTGGERTYQFISRTTDPRAAAREAAEMMRRPETGNFAEVVYV